MRHCLSCTGAFVTLQLAARTGRSACTRAGVDACSWLAGQFAAHACYQQYDVAQLALQLLERTAWLQLSDLLCVVCQHLTLQLRAGCRRAGTNKGSAIQGLELLAVLTARKLRWHSRFGCRKLNRAERMWQW